MRIVHFFILIALSSTWLTSTAQQKEVVDSALTLPFIRFQYTLLEPSGDFEETYGSANAVGGAFGIKLANNWQFELEGNFIFGTNIQRQGILDDIINSNGDVTDSDGELIKIIYNLRGFSAYANVGKVFTFQNGLKNSGILAQAGIGFLQHKIFFDYRDGEAFQLSEDNLKGYDRLHNGVAFKQFLGYQYFGKKNLVNFYIGVEFQEAFTVNRRGYNYDTKMFDIDQKFDLLYGLRFGWSFTLRSRASEEFYYY